MRYIDRFRQILWLENSGHALARSIAMAFGATVTSRISNGSQYHPRLGKGYGEAALLEEYQPETVHGYVVKCSGRLHVSNIAQLLDRLDGDVDLVIRLSQDLAYVDSRLFASSTAMWRELVDGLKDSVDDRRGTYLEHALARRVLLLAHRGARIGFWPVVPRFSGQSASTGLDYSSVREQLKWLASSALYRVKRLGAFL